jgi:hypothetical protein
MAKKTKKVEVEQETEYELDSNLMEEISVKLESAINRVIKKNSNKEIRLELLMVVISFSAQIAAELGVDEGDYMNLCNDFLHDHLTSMEDEGIIEPGKAEVDKGKLN